MLDRERLPEIPLRVEYDLTHEAEELRGLLELLLARVDGRNGGHQ